MSDGERFDAYLWHRLSTLLTDSQIPDVEPLSMTVRPDADTLTVTVRSRSRGAVAIGTIEHEELDAGIAAVTEEQIALYREHDRDVRAFAFEPIRAYAEALEASRRKPLEAKARKKAAHVERAVALRLAGHSPNRIAQIMSDEGAIRGDKDPVRTVKRWLADAK